VHQFASSTPLRTAVCQLVRLIPAGSVATYGQIAAYAGSPRAARQVGAVLAGLPQDTPVPWQRVINAAGATAHVPKRAPSKYSACCSKKRASASAAMALSICTSTYGTPKRPHISPALHKAMRLPVLQKEVLFSPQ